MQKNFYDITPFNFSLKKKDVIEMMNPLLKNVIIANKNKKIFDIGCGCGRNLMFAIDYSSKLLGLDFSQKSLAIARNILGNKVELIHANNLNIPLENNIADLVISDGVCHHTGNTQKAFYECVRLLKPNGLLYLAIYKKYRYYPLIYFSLGFILRMMMKYSTGKKIIENFIIKLYYLIYKYFKNNKLSLAETRNIFFDYFLTPIATFHSKNEVKKWVNNSNSKIVDYDRTNGNCHVFLIKKNVR